VLWEGQVSRGAASGIKSLTKTVQLNRKFILNFPRRMEFFDGIYLPPAFALEAGKIWKTPKRAAAKQALDARRMH